MPKHESNLLNSSKSLTVVNATTDNTISIDQNGNVGTAVATDGALHIENTGNTGIGLGVYSNIGSSAEAALVVIKIDNSDFDQNVVDIINDGAGTGLHIIQNGVNGAGKRALTIELNSELTNSEGILFYSNFAHAVGNTLIQIQNDNPTSVAPLVNFKQDGGNKNVMITSASGAHIQFLGDPANSSSSDGDLWFDGTNLKINVGGTVYNVDKTAV